MGVFRIEKTGNYTVMSNYHFKDKSISLKAKGLLSQMLSLPEDWDYTLSGLATINKEGKDAIRSAINELEKAGYVYRRQRYDSKGQFSHNEYFVFEYPDEIQKHIIPPLSETPSSENPTTDNPSADNPTTENPTQLNTNIQNTNQQNTYSINSSSINYAQMIEERRRWKELIEERLEYDLLRNQKGMELLDVAINAMVSVICSQNPKIKIRGDEYEQSYVKEKFLSLDEYHVTYALDVYDDNKAHVKCTSAYLIPLLFEAPEKADDYYAALYYKDHS